MLPREFYRRVDWENPIAEHESVLLQKAYIDVFETGDMDPEQDRPRDIREPKTTWLGHYIDHVAMLKKARNCLPLHFWLYNRKIRIASRENVQIAMMCSGVDKSDLPTKEDLIRDKQKKGGVRI